MADGGEFYSGRPDRPTSYISELQNVAREASVNRPVIRYDNLTIARAQNGFVVLQPSSSRHEGCRSSYVFSNFDSLTDWLREHLEGAE